MAKIRLAIWLAVAYLVLVGLAWVFRNNPAALREWERK